MCDIRPLSLIYVIKKIRYYRGVSVVDQLNTPPPLIPYFDAYISYWRPVVCNDTTQKFQKNLPQKKKLYNTVDLKMYKLDPNEDDPSGVAARQLLVGLVPLHHRHLTVEMKIKQHLQHFQTGFGKKHKFILCGCRGG